MIILMADLGPKVLRSDSTPLTGVLLHSFSPESGGDGVFFRVCLTPGVVCTFRYTGNPNNWWVVCVCV